MLSHRKAAGVKTWAPGYDLHHPALVPCHPPVLFWCPPGASELAPSSLPPLPSAPFSGAGQLPSISQEAVCVLQAGRKLAINISRTSILEALASRSLIAEQTPTREPFLRG